MSASRFALCLMLLPLSALAEEVVAPAAYDRPGQATARWLELQSGGTAASANPQAANQLVREKAVERQLKTYDLPIPASAFGSTFGTGTGAK